MAEINIREEKCTGCGYCAKVCPAACIEMKPSEEARTSSKGKVPFPKLAVIDKAKCILCKACVEACKKLNADAPDKNLFAAIELTESAAPKKDISAHKGVWVFAEELHGTLSPTAYELLFIGRKIADDLGQELCAVTMGKDVTKFAQDLIAHGADKVYAIDHPALENFLDDLYCGALAELILSRKPNKFILPATTIGRSLAAKTAILTDTGLTADATDLVIEKSTGLLHATRPTFGGNLMATIVCKHSRPEMCSLRPMTYPKAAKDASRKGEVVNIPFDPAKHTTKAKFVSFTPEETEEIDIGAAEVIVAGGRGMAKAEAFSSLKELAHLLNGAVGASRAAVDAGWIGYRHQIGLTGKTVKPKVYFAVGISGQVQHMAGMSSSDVIIAINKDPDAPLMQQATYAVEGDLNELVPALVEELKNARK